ncbi:MAG: PDZ domain-containing protein [Actinobacteria bacterium]|nr:PDZ domain-containing protein [Actinomycetota bacterium]
MKRRIIITAISFIAVFIIFVPVLTGCSIGKFAFNFGHRGFYGMNFKQNLKSQKEFNYKNMPCWRNNNKFGNKQIYRQMLANTPFAGIKMTVAPNGTKGVLVINVVPGSPAENAGIKPQDIITAIDGKTINKPQELLQQVLSHKVGDTVKLTISRNGQSQDLNVTLTGWPALSKNNLQNGQNYQNKQNNLQNSGIQNQQTGQNKTY